MKGVNSAPATVTVVLGAAAACIIAFGHLTPAARGAGNLAGRRGSGPW